MKGVKRGERVRWSGAAELAPGASQRERAEAAQLERVGLVLDRHPNASTWWCKADDARQAVPVKARDLEPAASMHGAA